MDGSRRGRRVVEAHFDGFDEADLLGRSSACGARGGGGANGQGPAATASRATFGCRSPREGGKQPHIVAERGLQ
eukprot:361194-Alexandrium_andersonii.AAC.1